MRNFPIINIFFAKECTLCMLRFIIMWIISVILTILTNRFVNIFNKWRKKYQKLHIQTYALSLNLFTGSILFFISFCSAFISTYSWIRCSSIRSYICLCYI